MELSAAIFQPRSWKFFGTRQDYEVDFIRRNGYTVKRKEIAADAPADARPICLTIKKEYFEMELVTIRELFKNREAYLDKQVTVGGWIRSIRDSKTFGFIVVNDGSYFEPLQIVYHDKMDNFQEISNRT